ncbi:MULTISPECIES: hypothetical protein [Anaerostipes]|uniref:Uncharacterized protein n=2 Tax=Anaerostipes TaxID=207244 RepID=A0ABV4DLW2_9FIRM|nr:MULTISPECIES: hypothetical protein [Anaerostipes]MBC5678336.1 hypothetical protein [Anaerostipes hominis (ex Liu et al. 2021)]MBS4928761.1 hypothetical protein [Anaerostipes sp.]
MRDENFCKNLCSYVEKAKQGDETAYEHLNRQPGHRFFLPESDPDLKS